MLDNTQNSLHNWADINWKAVNRELLKLKRKIWTNTKIKKFKNVKNYQRLIISSQANILASIRKVTQMNSGSETSGLDNITYSTPEDRLKLYIEINSLNFKDYNPTPVKRIYVPKPDGRQRPIGIPTIKDRVIQQIIKNALEPEWEAKFEPSSYGFRPSRSVNDACNRLFVMFNSPNSREWIVDADITGCFDNINHDYLMDKIKDFPYKHIILKWLQSGIAYQGIFFETDSFGTPQGSIISPLLANIALHGMEKELGVVLVNKEKHYVKTGSRTFVRYADDFVVVCYTLEDAQLVSKNLVEILAKRGLTLSQSKTSIKHITNGFDFLGFNIKREPFDGFSNREVFIPLNSGIQINYKKSMLIIKPSEKSINKFKDKIKETFNKHKGQSSAPMILELNSIIRGWAQSKMYWHCNRTFHKLDEYLFNLQVRWIKRQHPNKPWNWLVEKYFYHKKEGRINNKWVFYSTLKNKQGQDYKIDLLQLKWFPHIDWIMLAHARGVYSLEDYYFLKDLKSRREIRKPVTLIRGFDLNLAKKQNNICPVCNDSLWNEEQLHKHHIIPRKEGGKDTPSNLIILHLPCHQKVHYAEIATRNYWKDVFIRIKR